MQADCIREPPDGQTNQQKQEGEDRRRGKVRREKEKKRRGGADAYLVAALGVHVDRGEEAGLGGVGVDPPQRVQRPAVLGLKYLLFI